MSVFYFAVIDPLLGLPTASRNNHLPCVNLRSYTATMFSPYSEQYAKEHPRGLSF